MVGTETQTLMACDIQKYRMIITILYRHEGHANGVNRHRTQKNDADRYVYIYRMHLHDSYRHETHVTVTYRNRMHMAGAYAHRTHMNSTYRCKSHLNGSYRHERTGVVLTDRNVHGRR